MRNVYKCQLCGAAKVMDSVCWSGGVSRRNNTGSTFSFCITPRRWPDVPLANLVTPSPCIAKRIKVGRRSRPPILLKYRYLRTWYSTRLSAYRRARCPAVDRLGTYEEGTHGTLGSMRKPNEIIMQVCACLCCCSYVRRDEHVCR